MTKYRRLVRPFCLKRNIQQRARLVPESGNRKKRTFSVHVGLTYDCVLKVPPPLGAITGPALHHDAHMSVPMCTIVSANAIPDGAVPPKLVHRNGCVWDVAAFVLEGSVSIPDRIDTIFSTLLHFFIVRHFMMPSELELSQKNWLTEQCRTVRRRGIEDWDGSRVKVMFRIAIRSHSRAFRHPRSGCAFRSCD